jgi:hypothetical protein
MASIPVACPACGSKRNVPENEVCLGVRCGRCETFMEAERNSNLDALDYYLTGRRKSTRTMPLIAKIALSLLIILNIAEVPVGVLGGAKRVEDAPLFIVVLVAFFLVIAALNVTFLVALFFFKKWGFYAFTALALLGMVLMITGGEIVLAVLSMIPVLLLYGVLHIGNPNTWSQLE